MEGSDLSRSVSLSAALFLLLSGCTVGFHEIDPPGPTVQTWDLGHI